MPADLLALYDKIRASSGGRGAAELRRGQCGGCREMLSTVELNEIRAAAPDEVIRHEECRRILVRTADSGLLARVTNQPIIPNGFVVSPVSPRP